jgi:hypothetical protein
MHCAGCGSVQSEANGFDAKLAIVGLNSQYVLRPSDVWLSGTLGVTKTRAKTMALGAAGGN